MDWSTPRHRYRLKKLSRKQRIAAAATILAVFVGTVTVSGVSSAEEEGPQQKAKNGVEDPKGLDVLARNCEEDSKLPEHDGFQKGERCVATEMGEVGSADQNPSLLITQAPRQVKPNQPFTIRVSTRNLIRDRFLAAAKGGYFVEMSTLDEQGLVRGHFHTACRMLGSTRAAPDPAPIPAFFVATEDKGGDAKPDQVVIQVPGLPGSGVAQCASWAGDGSHRVPMMQRANQIPAFDAVRIEVTDGKDEVRINNATDQPPLFPGLTPSATPTPRG